MKEAWDYCVQRSRSVEIVYRDEDHNSILTKVHFDLATKVNEACFNSFTLYTSFMFITTAV